MFINNKYYINLISQFLNREIAASEFESGYLELWTQDRKAADELRDSWEERYDLQLRQLYKEGKINGDEFDRRWFKLWKYDNEDEIHFANLINSIFISVESFCESPELYDEDDIDEEQLRKEVQDKYDRLIKIPIDE